MAEGQGASGAPATGTPPRTAPTDETTRTTGATPPTSAPTDPGAHEGDETDEEVRDPKALLRTYKQLQEQSKAQRTELQRLKDAQKLSEDAKLSEQDRLAKRVAELEGREKTLAAQVREKAIRYDIALTSQKLGIVDPDAAYRLLDEGALEFDEATGSPTNTEKALAALVKARPYLVREGATGSTPVLGATNSASRARGPEGARIYRASELNDTAFFRAHRDDIARAMNEGRIIADQ